jgi:hypothetical protein
MKRNYQLYEFRWRKYFTLIVQKTRYEARIGESRVAYRVLVGKPDGRRPLGKHRLRWEDNIKMDTREVEWLGGGGHRLDRSGSG